MSLSNFTLNCSNLNKKELEILDYCIKHSSEISSIKIIDLATKLKSSPASIERFCKKLNFSGFSEFKVALNFKLKNDCEKNEYSSDIYLNDIRKSIDIINQTTIEKVAKLIHEKNRIHIFSLGNNSLISTDLCQKFQSINKHFFSYSDSSSMYMCSSNANSSDLIIAISSSGEREQILSAINVAKSKNIKIICITDIGNNTLSKLSDISLYMISSSFLNHNIEIKSRAQLLILCDYIFFKYVELFSN